MFAKIKMGILFFVITWMAFSTVAGNSIKPSLDFYPTIWLVALIPSAFSFVIGYKVG
jgi:uncharacterized membrane protein (Fun14 family)